jgi:hypothetical protein
LPEENCQNIVRLLEMASITTTGASILLVGLYKYRDQHGVPFIRAGVEMSKPSLINIMRNTLQQVEEKVDSGENGPAVSELRKQIALNVAEVERVKDVRSAVAEGEPRLILVTRRPSRSPEGESTITKERRRENPRSRRPRLSE